MTNCENARRIALTLGAPKLQQTDVLARDRSSLLNHTSTVKIAKALIKYGRLKMKHEFFFWQDSHKKKIDLSQFCRLQ